MTGDKAKALNVQGRYKYTEIFRLKKMLEQVHIPFVYAEHSIDTKPYGKWEHYQICYPCAEADMRVCSVIEGDRTYGHEDDLLEIMGLLAPEEENYDSVVGSLTAYEVFARINDHYKRMEQEVGR